MDSRIVLHDLGDVDAAAPDDQSVLVFNAANSNWVPGQPQAQSGGSSSGSTTSGYVTVTAAANSNTVTTNGFTVSITGSGNTLDEVSSMVINNGSIVEYFIVISGALAAYTSCILEVGDFASGTLVGSGTNANGTNVPGSFTYVPSYDFGPTNKTKSYINKPWSDQKIGILDANGTHIQTHILSTHNTISHFTMHMHFPLLAQP